MARVSDRVRRCSPTLMMSAKAVPRSSQQLHGLPVLIRPNSYKYKSCDTIRIISHLSHPPHPATYRKPCHPKKYEQHSQEERKRVEGSPVLRTGNHHQRHCYRMMSTVELYSSASCVRRAQNRLAQASMISITRRVSTHARAAIRLFTRAPPSSRAGVVGLLSLTVHLHR